MRSAFADRFAADAKGSAAIEFAAVAPVLIAFMMGIMTLGVAYYQGMTVQWALERSLRTAMIEADTDIDDIEALMADDLARIGSPDINLTYVIDDTGEVPLAIVTAQYAAPLNIPFAPHLVIQFSFDEAVPVPIV